MSALAAVVIVGVLWLAAAAVLIAHFLRKPKSRVVVRLAGFSWTRGDFCRGWLITGDTGSGKTRSGITPLLFQVFQNEPTWGGLCIDDKGLYWETLSQMAKHFGREDDLILLQVRPDGAASSWRPRHAYNLTSDRSIPYNTFAKAVVDTASSLGQAGDKSFFRNQAQTHIAAALETLREIGADVTLENAYHLLLDQSDLDEAMTDLASGHQTTRRRELIEHFTNRFLAQPPEQIGGVKETIANYLQAFITPEIAQVFCPGANTFDFADIDRGKIICVAMPQKFQMERRYVNTFLKMLFYTHALRRFDKPAEERRRDNLLILWADEAQRFVTRQRGRHERLQLHRRHPRSAGHGRRRRTILHFIHPAPRSRKSPRLHPQSPQPPHLQSRRRRRRPRKRRLPRQEDASSRNRGATPTARCHGTTPSRKSTRSSHTSCARWKSTPQSSSIARKDIGKTAAAHRVGRTSCTVVQVNSVKRRWHPFGDSSNQYEKFIINDF